MASGTRWVEVSWDHGFFELLDPAMWPQRSPLNQPRCPIGTKLKWHKNSFKWSSDLTWVDMSWDESKELQCRRDVACFASALPPLKSTELNSSHLNLSRFSLVQVASNAIWQWLTLSVSLQLSQNEECRIMGEQNVGFLHMPVTSHHPQSRKRFAQAGQAHKSERRSFGWTDHKRIAQRSQKATLSLCWTCATKNKSPNPLKPDEGQRSWMVDE